MQRMNGLQMYWIIELGERYRSLQNESDQKN